MVAYLNIDRAVQEAVSRGSEEEALLLREIADRKTSVQAEQDRFIALCDRFDNLYYANTVLQHAGASHWAEHRSAKTVGMSHISINTPAEYVDIPASLQSIPPVHNMLAVVDSDEGRQAAAMAERLFHAWTDSVNFDLLGHEACIVKSLYGRTAGKVFWDPETNRPALRIVDQPRNLYLGWATSDWKRLDWALYTYRMTGPAVYAEWGLEVSSHEERNGNIIPFVLPPDAASEDNRGWIGDMGLEVEVYDYWYRRAAPRRRTSKRRKYQPQKMETWNCIFVGNVLVKAEKHPEYDGVIPYVPLFNTYVPGVPDGKAELYDVEPLIREKDERLSDGAQLLHRVIEGQMWQLTGPEAPDVIPAAAVPKANKVAAPGPGNRIENISPWLPQFQLEQHLQRIDREMADVTGLNDLLRGLAPSEVLSSSKAINALVANYEARIRIKRDLYYEWLLGVWDLVSTIWASKQPELALLFAASKLDLVAPSLTPRDDMETAVMASNLVRDKLWSQKRGMDRTGVDDPEEEENIIKAEQTDAAMNPAAVQVMAQLMLVLRELGVQAPEAAAAQAQQQAAALNQYRAMLGGGQGTPMMNAPEEQLTTPAEGMPANTPEGQALQGPPEGGSMESQTLLRGGEAQNQIVTQTPIREE